MYLPPLVHSGRPTLPLEVTEMTTTHLPTTILLTEEETLVTLDPTLMEAMTTILPTTTPLEDTE